MSYAIEWIGGVGYAVAVFLLIIPEFAMLAVLVVALAALVVLVALAAAALASPYLLVRVVRRRLARRTTRRIHVLSRIRSRPVGSPAARAEHM